MPPSHRAQVRLDAETSAIRIFKGADLSNIPHESAHIFVDDLRRVAVDDGSIARERLRADLEQSGMDAAERLRRRSVEEGTASDADAGNAQMFRMKATCGGRQRRYRQAYRHAQD